MIFKQRNTPRFGTTRLKGKTGLSPDMQISSFYNYSFLWKLMFFKPGSHLSQKNWDSFLPEFTCAQKALPIGKNTMDPRLLGISVDLVSQS